VKNRRKTRQQTCILQTYTNKTGIDSEANTQSLILLGVIGDYLISTTAPASSNCFFKASASSLETPAFNSFGAASTKSFASFKPRPARSFTNLTTANF